MIFGKTLWQWLTAFAGIQYFAEGGGGTIDVGTISQQLSTLNGEQFQQLIPETIRGEAYLKDVFAAEKPWEAFNNKFHGAQKMIGRDPFPKADSPDDKWDEFFRKIRPETDDKYGFPKIEGAPDDFMPAEFQAEVRKMAHAAGLAPKQFERFLTPFLSKVYGAEKADKDAADALFEKTMNETFGAERENVMKVAKEVLASNLDEKQKHLLNMMDEKGIAIVSALASSLFKKFGQEDAFRGGAGAPGAGAVTMQSLTNELRTAMSDPAYANPFKDKIAHENAVRKVEAIKEKMAKLTQR